METNPIYLEYQIRETSFDTTLSLLGDLISERLSDEYTKIWVQGSNSGSIRLCFTVFSRNGGYTIFTTQMKNFRNWKSDGEIVKEVNLMETMIAYLASSVMPGVIC